MYDFTRDLDEAGKKNLRDFVESGEGGRRPASRPAELPEVALVVPRRRSAAAIACSARATSPSSSVKDDQEISVTPARDASDHGGDRALPHHGRNLQAHVDLAASPAAPDHRQSQQRLASWPGSGPNTGRRVVAIQLGHGPTAFAQSRPTGRSFTTPSSGRPAKTNDGASPVGRRRPTSPLRLERGIAMKLGLYSITYLGLWYRGEALSLPR